MANSIDERLKRLRARVLWQAEQRASPAKRQPSHAPITDTPISPLWRERAEQQAAKALAAAAHAKIQAEKAARRQAKLDARQRRWHQRYFMRTGRWHPDADRYVNKTPRLMSDLRYRAKHMTPDG